MRLLRRLRSVEGDARTEVLHRLAETVVAMREHFYGDDGAPDWTGKTYPYRQEVSAIFGEGGVTPEESPAVRAAMRYHVGNVLRERLPAEELARLGLRTESPKERSRETRAHRTEIVQASRTPRPRGVGAIQAAATMLREVDPALVTGLPARERRLAAQALREIAALVAALTSSAS